MATAITPPVNLDAQSANQTHKTTLYNKFIAFADRQSESKTLWFLISMIFQGVFFLPVPAILMYFYNAPVIVLIVTLSLFFGNIISGMGGAGTRVLLGLFVASVVIHIVMVAIFVI